MDGRGQDSATPPGGMPVVKGAATDSLLDELKKFAGRLASFGLGEETGRLLRDTEARGPVRSRPAPALPRKP